MAADVAAKGVQTDEAQEPFDGPPAPGPCEARALTAGALPPGHRSLLPQLMGRLRMLGYFLD
jgi:hypothetical protein